MARPTTAARRYADAIFEIAGRDDQLDTTLDELRTAATLLGNEDAARIVDNPAVPLRDREQVIDRLLDGRASAAVGRLVVLLARRGRVDLIDGIAAEFERLLNRRNGVATALVTSARPLGDDQVDAIRNRVAAMAGTRIDLRTAVDPALIGGLTVRVGDRLLDASVRGRLERLRNQLVSGTRQSPSGGR